MRSENEFAWPVAARWTSLPPGLALCAIIAVAAFAIRQIPGVATFSPMILSILLGIAVQNLAGMSAAARPGVTFSMKRILRFGIILLGFQLTAQQIAKVGVAGVGIVVVCVIACFVFTLWAGTKFGVERKLAELIAAGTSICGASAVVATNAVTEASDEDTSYAIVCVTMFGTLAMFVYPMLAGFLDLGPRAYGLWTGASIHEVAQVVAAAYQHGKNAGDYGAVTKLTRVVMLAPMVIALGAYAARRQVPRAGIRKARAPAPWFVLGFVAAAAFNSVVTIAPGPKAAMVTVTTFLLSMALAALGLETDIRKVRAKGMRPLLLGATATLFIALLSLLLVKLAV